MTQVVTSVPAPSAFELADRIDSEGYATVEDFVSPDELRGAQAFVRRAVADAGGQYILFSGGKSLGGTFLERMGADPAFVDLCRQIYERGTGKPAPAADFYQILRCLSGTQATRHSMRFHYDSYVLTALIPIMMPTRGSKGNLIIIPNIRPLRRWYGSNLIDKALIDNALSQAVFRAVYRRRKDKMTILELKPGNLYFFWGYKSLHTNEPCDADEIRSTALLHYADPHAASYTKKMLRRK